MGIHIGDNNKITNVNIVEDSDICVDIKEDKHDECTPKNKFHERHPFIFNVIIAVVAGVIVGVILMFGFWDDLVSFISGSN